MKKITFNGHAGAVGTGKSLNWIYPHVDNHLSLGNHVLQVVGGLENQKEILCRYPSAYILNYQNKKESTVLGEAQRIITSRSVKHLVVTQETFVRLQLSYLAKSEWVLFVDETFEVFRTIKHNAAPVDKNSNYYNSDTLCDLTSIIRIGNPVGHGYHEVHTTIPNDSILQESKSLQRLADINWMTEVNQVEYSKIGKESGVTEFYQYIDKAVLKGWYDVYIAGANYNNLEFGKWLAMNDYEAGSFVPFDKRDGKVDLYTTNECNSKYLQQTDTTFIERYHREFEKIIKDEELLRLRNEKTNKSILLYSNNTCTDLKHNMHGLNQYRNTHRTISFESALNQSKGFIAWMDKRHTIDEEVIFMTRTVDIAYQLIGRTAYRNPNNTEVITAGIPCKRTAYLLAQYYLKDADITVFDISKEWDSSKPLLNKMTPEERKEYNREKQRISRAKKKEEAHAKLIAEIFADLKDNELIMEEPFIEESLVIETIPAIIKHYNTQLEESMNTITDNDDDRTTALAKLKAMKVKEEPKPVEPKEEDERAIAIAKLKAMKSRF